MTCGGLATKAASAQARLRFGDKIADVLETDGNQGRPDIVTHAGNDDQFGARDALGGVPGGGRGYDRSSAPCRTRAGARTLFRSALRGGAAIRAADWRARPAGSNGARSVRRSAVARISPSLTGKPGLDNAFCTRMLASMRSARLTLFGGRNRTDSVSRSPGGRSRRPVVDMIERRLLSCRDGRSRPAARSCRPSRRRRCGRARRRARPGARSRRRPCRRAHRGHPGACPP